MKHCNPTLLTSAFASFSFPSWHEYDFSLSTGESSTGLKACVYAVEERNGSIWIQEPEHEIDPLAQTHSEHNWDVIEIRPVSESFCNGREKAAQSLEAAMAKAELDDPANKALEVDAPLPLPQTLVQWAVLILNTADPIRKVELTRQACLAFRSGECKRIGGGRWAAKDGGGKNWTISESEIPPEEPPRPSTTKTVMPGREGKRGKGGSEKSRIAMLHSLANIEQWAIDLAWDIIARAPQLYAQLSHNTTLPVQFFSDFVKIAEDEAKHFTILCNRLKELGVTFGDLPVHNKLWESAHETKDSLMARLCIIHLVHEARGLDANPLTIKKFENAGDRKSVETLTIIHLDEVTHVSAGHRWLTFICEHMDPKLQPVDVFRDNVRRHFAGKLKGPFNIEDRTKAGLSKDWYEELVGEKHNIIGVQRAEVAGG